MRSKKLFAVFITAIFAILFAANFVVYKAFLLAFGIYTNSLLLIIMMSFLGLSFIGSMLVNHRYYNLLSRFYYKLAMIWMGFFAYFFIASVMYVLEAAYIGDQNHYFAILIFSFSILAGIYGLLHARKLKIKNVKVTIPNFPQDWKSKKAVWISDLHMGQINGKNFMQKVVNQIKEVSPDIVFIGGDLFDGTSLPKVLESINPLKDLSLIQTYFIMGNHESYGDKELFQKAIREVGVQVLNNEKKVVDGVQIVGVDYETTQKKEDFEKVLTNIGIDENLPSILLKHEPSNVHVAEKAGVNFQISGHTHRAQQWPFEYLARLSYGKFTYGLNKMKNMQVYTSSGTGTWGIPMRVGTDSEIVIFEF